jgi:hypothetical protein
MPQIFIDFYNDILTKNYFALAAVTIMILTQVVKTLPWLQQTIWSKIPVGWRFLVPVVLSMAMVFVHGFLTGEAWQADLWDVVRAALGAMGGNAALTESVLPWGGGPGGIKSGIRRAKASPALQDAVLTDEDKTPIDGKPLPPSDPPTAA